MSGSATGSFYLIPIPIAEGKVDTIPDAVIQRIHSLNYFVAESARTARRFISSTNPPFALPEVSVQQFGKHDDVHPSQLLKPLFEGHDIGFMSEAGCPGIADPGAELVKWCHQNDLRVIPLTGPSSLILALMASGLNGQGFTFHGYLPRQKKDLVNALKSIERDSARNASAHLFIEAPYRNDQMLETILESLNPQTRVCVAANVTSDHEFIITKSIAEWEKVSRPELHKVPTVFILQAS